MLRKNREHGSKLIDDSGDIIELYGVIKLDEFVEWLGRKAGSGEDDHMFNIGQKYKVVHIYPSNGDVELQGDEPEITTRAGETEYRK